jgi:hypothetical protein
VCVVHKGTHEPAVNIEVWASCYDSTEYDTTNTQGFYAVSIADCPANAEVTVCNSYECHTGQNRVIEGYGIAYINLEIPKPTIPIVQEQEYNTSITHEGVSTKRLWCPINNEWLKYFYEYTTYQVVGCGVGMKVCNIKKHPELLMWRYGSNRFDNSTIIKEVCG